MEMEKKDNNTVEMEDTRERIPTQWRKTGRIPECQHSQWREPCADTCHHHIPNILHREGGNLPRGYMLDRWDISYIQLSLLLRFMYVKGLFLFSVHPGSK